MIYIIDHKDSFTWNVVHQFSKFDEVYCSNFDDINDYYVRQRVLIEDCDIFVSVSSKAGTKVSEIPTIVNRMLKYIDCKLSFSFTVI